MIHFEKEYFRRFEFTNEQIDRYFQNAMRDLKIVKEDSFPEVKFNYCFQALIKSGIALLAKKGSVKVRSVPGHHIKILAKMSEILRDPDILTIGNVMRTKRNLDFYGGGEFIGKREIREYTDFVVRILEKVKKELSVKGKFQ